MWLQGLGVARGGLGEGVSPPVKSPIPLNSPKWNEALYLVYGEQSSHFESWSAPFFKPEPPCCPVILKSLATPLCDLVLLEDILKEMWLCLSHSNFHWRIKHCIANIVRTLWPCAEILFKWLLYVKGSEIFMNSCQIHIQIFWFVTSFWQQLKLIICVLHVFYTL